MLRTAIDGQKNRQDRKKIDSEGAIIMAVGDWCQQQIHNQNMMPTKKLNSVCIGVTCQHEDWTWYWAIDAARS